MQVIHSEIILFLEDIELEACQEAQSNEGDMTNGNKYIENESDSTEVDEEDGSNGNEDVSTGRIN